MRHYDTLVNIWNRKKENLKPCNNLWDDEPINISNKDDLSQFQHNNKIHFCTSKVEGLSPIMLDRPKNINLPIATDLINIGDSTIGYNESDSSKLTSRPERIAGWVTANHILYLTFLFNRLKFEGPVNIVEFGGGYGNICRLIHKSKYYNVHSYTIMDLDGVDIIQDYFLSTTLHPEEHLKNRLVDSTKAKSIECDLFIANHSLSELNYQKYFEYSHLMSKARYVFISTCLSSHCEFMKLFHLCNTMDISDVYYENDSVGHFLFRKKNI